MQEILKRLANLLGLKSRKRTCHLCGGVTHGGWCAPCWENRASRSTQH